MTIPKHPNLPFLAAAIPVSAARADLLRPAGAVYPSSLTADGRLVFRWEDGFLADLLTPLAQQGSLLPSVNVPRLKEEIRATSGGDPWNLDRAAILEAMAYASMRSTRIKLLPSYDFTVPSAEGTWVWGDPLRPAIRGDGILAIAGLPIGFHVLFRDGPPGDAPPGAGARYATAASKAAGAAPSRARDLTAPEAGVPAAPRERISLFVDDRGWRAVDLLTGVIKSGRW